MYDPVLQQTRRAPHHHTGLSQLGTLDEIHNRLVGQCLMTPLPSARSEIESHLDQARDLTIRVLGYMDDVVAEKSRATILAQ